MEHLTDKQLNAYLDGAFKGRDAEAAGRHLAGCQPCREALAELAAQDESLKPALTHDPGEAYFESFATRVEERIGAAAASRAHPGGAFDLGRFFRSPRALAWAGGVAVVVVGGGLALMTGRDVLPPSLRDRDLATRLEHAAPGEVKRAPSSETRQAPPVPLPSVDDAGQAAPSADAGAKAQEASGVETPAASMTKEQVSPPGEKNVPLARPADDAKARADAFAPAPSSAPSATSAPAGARPASPSRAMEVRRNEAGEEVPVRRPAESRVAPPPSPTTTSGADQGGQVRKKLFAEPLDAAKKPATTRTLGATGAPSSRESAAREYSFAQPPPGPAATSKTERAAPGLNAVADVRLCGEVRDAASRPIAGAQVVLADIGRTTTSDARGRFCLSVPKGEHPLSVMAVGYKESRRSVVADGAETDVRLTLAAVSVLDEKGLTIAGRAKPDRVPNAIPVEPKDSYTALSDTLRRMVRDAQRLEADAAARRSAAAYDMTARTWERALRRLAGGPLEIETRWHLAEARYHAWEIGPNSRRALAAVEALTAYANRAPAGPERDQAVRWLNQVKP